LNFIRSTYWSSRDLVDMDTNGREGTKASKYSIAKERAAKDWSS